MKPRAVDAVEPAALAEPFMDALRELDLVHRLAVVRGTLCGRIVFTTSFGIEDQAIAHVIYTQALAIDVVTLDTGRLFPQTYEPVSYTHLTLPTNREV